MDATGGAQESVGGAKRVRSLEVPLRWGQGSGHLRSHKRGEQCKPDQGPAARPVSGNGPQRADGVSYCGHRAGQPQREFHFGPHPATPKAIPGAPAWRVAPRADARIGPMAGGRQHAARAAA